MNGPNFGLYADAGQLLPLETQGSEAVLRPADFPADLVSLYRWKGTQYGAPIPARRHPAPGPRRPL